jgi:tRNA-specific 2-thiouridylase
MRRKSDISYNRRMHPLPAPKDTGTVIVGMSGGVDSAVSALLLQEAGFDVQALFMSNWDDDDSYCTAATDYQDARQVCAVLNIPLHRVSFAAEYRERVFAHFLKEYAAGRTPNPDVLCNREIKFGICLDYMDRLGASWIATGHYARTRRTGTGAQLLKAADQAKDQSYFLHQVTPAALRRTLFPLGELRKDEVRKRAHAAGLKVYDKPDSTGICFIGERPFDQFLGRYLVQAPGPIETAEGRVVGEHRGLALYTLGQRSGLRIGGRAGAAAAPWYVAAKEAGRNALIVVQDPDHPLLLSDAFDVEKPHWFATAPGGSPPRATAPGGPPPLATAPDAWPPRATAPGGPPPLATAPDAWPSRATAPGVATPGDFHCGVKTRYRQSDLPCRVRVNDDGVHVVLRDAARAVTPGQYAVFYDGDVCLGGGVIARRYNNTPRCASDIAYNSQFSAEGS